MEIEIQKLGYVYITQIKELKIYNIMEIKPINNIKNILFDSSFFFKIVVEDTTKIDSLMGKNDFAASKFALELRLEIWKEIFGFDSQDMVDPIEKELWNRIRERAKVFSKI